MSDDEAGLIFTRVEREVVNGSTHNHSHKVLRRPVQHGEFNIVHCERFQHEIHTPGPLVEGPTNDVQTTEQQVAVRHEGMLVFLEWQTTYTQNSNKAPAQGGIPPVQYTWPNRLCIDFSAMLSGGGAPVASIPTDSDVPLAKLQKTFAVGSSQGGELQPTVGHNVRAGSHSSHSTNHDIRVYSAMPSASTTSIQRPHAPIHNPSRASPPAHGRRRQPTQDVEQSHAFTEQHEDDTFSDNDDSATICSESLQPPSEEQLKRLKREYNAMKARLQGGDGMAKGKKRAL